MGPRTAVVLEGVLKAVHRVQHTAALWPISRVVAPRPAHANSQGCGPQDPRGQEAHLFLGAWSPT